MISIEMITKNDNNIEESINSILGQEFSDYEIIIVDSSYEDHSRTYQNNSKIKYIYEKDSNFLKARYLANRFAVGDYVLLLDSTRMLDELTLQDCFNLGEIYDMLVIPEVNRSKSFLLNQKVCYNIELSDVLKNCNPVNGKFVPRFYKKEIIDKAFEIVLDNIKKEVENICALEDRMLYLEASKLSTKIGICNNSIMHRESNSLLIYMRKYLKYGKCNYFVYSNINYYSHLADPKVKSNNKKPLAEGKSLKNAILFGIRSVCFLVGFYTCKLSN